MTLDQAIERPVFICGAPRSGTTLIRNLLDSHPELTIFPSEIQGLREMNRMARFGQDAVESYFRRETLFRDLAKYHDPFDDPEGQMNRSYESSFGNVLEGEAAVDGPAFVAEYLRRIDAGPVDYRGYLTAVAGAYLSALKAPPPSTLKRFVFKRPLDFDCAAVTLKRQFPDARFIHILRDPRTRYATVKFSRIRRAWMYRPLGLKVRKVTSFVDSRYDFVRGIAGNTMLSFDMARTNKAVIGDDYQVIRFEDLMADTTAIMDRMAAFLGIERLPILDEPTYHGVPFHGNSRLKQDFAGKVVDIHGPRMALYRSLTNPTERMVVAIANKALSEIFGYEWDDDLRLSGRDILRLLRPFRFEELPQFVANRRGLARWIPEFSQRTARNQMLLSMIEDWHGGTPYGYD
ncbi:MAG: sulfotransferase [Rhodobacterales bacterium]|nr:sulfotransferase [Rhodobacterales bacterium]